MPSQKWHLSSFFSSNHQLESETMAPENEETQEPLADSPTETSNPNAPVAPADPPDGQEVVQDQTVVETHIQEGPADDEDAADDEDEDGDSEE